jgi:molybdenum cofactor biosynthesis enzyme MoaA
MTARIMILAVGELRGPLARRRGPHGRCLRFAAAGHPGRHAKLSRKKDWRRDRGDRSIGSAPPLAPAAAFVENSPALAGVADARSRRAFDSPLYVNTALREMMTCPRERGRVAGDPARMAAALLAQRGVSRVPWVFNSLLNDIECRLGVVEPESVPTEVHLSLTGLCNIECRFCAYEHANARVDFVDVARVGRLDFLRFAQTFRLHSGLGESTTSKHLAPIIEHVAGRFPHLGMNFFTNAVLLDRPGLTEALVGNVRWINASLNAASRESWKDLCKVDLFARVERNLRALHRAKRERRSLLPLVFGSMVLTRANLADLPRMPALCRALGIDRFTAFPYFGLGYHGRDKYGPEMTLEACRREYDEVYWRTVQEAQAHEVSLEIPLPGAEKRTAFGLEARPLHDFARVESNEWKLGRFVYHLDWDVQPGEYCPALWRAAGIGRPIRAAGPGARRTSSTPASALSLAWICRRGRPFASPARMTSGGCGGIPCSRSSGGPSTRRA